MFLNLMMVFKTVDALFLYKMEKTIFSITSEPKKNIFLILADAECLNKDF